MPLCRSLVVVVAIVASTHTALGAGADYGALMDLYTATGGAHWLANGGWGVNTDPCSGWFGVECQSDRVISM